jgi:Cytochrome P450/Transposase IS116/IS110/IS902 family
VLECSRTPRAERRLRGKDDALDAVRTARAALASETLAPPRSGERREALRLLLVARRSAVDVRREALGQLHGVIVTAPDQLRQELRRLPFGRLLERCRRLRRSSAMSADEAATRLVLRSLASRIHAATIEAAELEHEILGHVRALAPGLLDEPGIGRIVAAQLIVAWSHPGRLRSEAAFARLAGVAPVPASSGKTTRHRAAGDLLSLLLEARDEQGEPMPDTQVRDEAMTIFLAGHETTAVTLTWTWMLLARHPAVEGRLHRELDEVLGTRAPTVDDLPGLAYADMVLREAMRLYPPAWLIGRRALVDVELGGYVVPAGSIVILSP